VLAHEVFREESTVEVRAAVAAAGAHWGGDLVRRELQGMHGNSVARLDVGRYARKLVGSGKILICDAC